MRPLAMPAAVVFILAQQDCRRLAAAIGEVFHLGDGFLDKNISDTFSFDALLSGRRGSNNMARHDLQSSEGRRAGCHFVRVGCSKQQPVHAGKAAIAGESG